MTLYNDNVFRFVLIVCTLSSVTSFQACVFSNCLRNYTVGEVIDNKCIFLHDHITTFYLNTYILHTDKTRLFQLFHRLTRRFYKLTLKTRITLTGYFLPSLKENLRMPSFFGVSKINCPVYDISTNILYDEYNSCTKRATLAVTNTYNIVDSFENYHCSKDYDCVKVERLSKKECNLVSIETHDEYKLIEQFAIFHKNKIRGFVIRFNQNKVHLKQSDYFIHVSSMNKYNDPFSCHYVHIEAGKIFQLNDCVNWQILFHDNPLKLCYNNKRKCKLQSCE